MLPWLLLLGLGLWLVRRTGLLRWAAPSAEPGYRSADIPADDR